MYIYLLSCKQESRPISDKRPSSETVLRYSARKHVVSTFTGNGGFDGFGVSQSVEHD